jgi:hypothetical protein
MNYINEKDLLHFNEKGWVVIKNVLTPKEISAYLQKTSNSENLNEFFESEKIKGIIDVFHNGENWDWNRGDENKRNYKNVLTLVRNKVDNSTKQNNFEWHIDGISFHHKLMSKNISLILLPYLQCNNGPKSGQTVFKNGSHKYIANILKNMDDGIPYLILSVISNLFTPSFIFPEEEIRISPGDILISHPFTVHKRSLNYSYIPRICFRITCQWKNKIIKNSPVGQIIYDSLFANNSSIVLSIINDLINMNSFLKIHDILLDFSKYIKP